MKILPRKNTKEPVESKDPKAPVKRRSRKIVTRKRVVISLASVAGLLTAVAALVAAVRPIFPVPAPKPEPSPTQQTIIIPTPAPNPSPGTRGNRDVAAVITWPPGAPLQSGPNANTMVKLNIPAEARVTIKSATCRNREDIVSEMPGRWCQAMYKQDGKLHRGWTFDAYFQREEEN